MYTYACRSLIVYIYITVLNMYIYIYAYLLICIYIYTRMKIFLYENLYTVRVCAYLLYTDIYIHLLYIDLRAFVTWVRAVGSVGRGLLLELVGWTCVGSLVKRAC